MKIKSLFLLFFLSTIPHIGYSAECDINLGPNVFECDFLSCSAFNQNICQKEYIPLCSSATACNYLCVENMYWNGSTCAQCHTLSSRAPDGIFNQCNLTVNAEWVTPNQSARCKANFYQDQTVCTACGDGYTTSGAGATQQSDCKKQIVIPCVQDNCGNIVGAVNCTYDTASNPKTITHNLGTPIPSGNFCNVQSFECGGGFYKDGNSCKPCTAGNFCDGITQQPCVGDSISADGAESCTSCPTNMDANPAHTSCTKNCAIAPFNTGVLSATGTTTCNTQNCDSIDIYSGCVATKCNGGFHLASGQCGVCPTGWDCDGTITAKRDCTTNDVPNSAVVPTNGTIPKNKLSCVNFTDDNCTDAGYMTCKASRCNHYAYFNDGVCVKCPNNKILGTTTTLNIPTLLTNGHTLTDPTSCAYYGGAANSGATKFCGSDNRCFYLPTNVIAGR